jgi:hypothetical protein
MADKKPTYEQLKHALEVAPPIRQVPDMMYEKWVREVRDKALDGTLVVKK